MKKFFLVGFLVLLSSVVWSQSRFGSRRTFFNVDYENPQQYYIGGITVSGVEFLDPDAIVALTGLKVGDKINVPGEDISNAIKKLWEQGLIGDVSVSVSKVEGKTIFLNFELKERPRLSRFIFEGVTKSEKEDLEGKIDLARGNVVTDALIKNATYKIREFYLEKGYYNVEVTIQPPIKDTILDNNVILKVVVQKNKKVHVNKIFIEGDSLLSQKEIISKMKKTKPSQASNLWTGSKMIRKTYEDEKAAVINFYNSKGYRDAQIITDSVVASKQDKVDIYITLDEGRKYYFRNIVWKGNYVYTDKVLNEILGIKKGDVYNFELLEKRLSFNPSGVDVSSLYLDNGYLFFSVDPVEVLVEGDSIDLELRIFEGEQALIDKIVISGNTKTHDHVIQREVKTYPGDKFSRSDLIRTQRELAALNYFDNESLGLNPIPNPTKGTVDVGYSVKEKPNDQIELSGGYGGFFGFVGTVGVVFNNFSAKNITNFKKWNPVPSGDGQRLAFRVQANGRTFQTYSVSFTEPWLGGRKPTSLNVSLSHSVQSRMQPGVRPLKKIGSLQVTSLSVTIGRRLKWPDEYFNISHGLAFTRYTLDNYDFRNSSQALGFTTGYANNINYTLTISRNNIDNFQFPTTGGNIALSLSLTPPYSAFNGVNYEDPNLDPKLRYRWVEYHKWNFDFSWFTPVWQHVKNNKTTKHKLIFHTRFHFGLIGSYNPQVGIGPFERFIMGGDGLSGFNFLLGSDIIGLRGYLNNTIKPNDADPISAAAGGIAFDKFVAELRYPLSNSPAFSIFVLGFFEAGNTWGNIRDINPFEVYRSAGFGTRIFMPAFGLIGIDWGVPLDYVPGTTNPAFKPHITFSIGQQIR
ncbi:MAG: outer membrane protein assembly factor BamA [Cytophagaceae bacterium]|nr:outer membrane protein assembly factor BamA [Cytophagaceae bacterium]